MFCTVASELGQQVVFVAVKWDCSLSALLVVGPDEAVGLYCLVFVTFFCSAG